MFMKLKQS